MTTVPVNDWKTRSPGEKLHLLLQPKDLPFNYSLPSEEKRKEAAEKTIVTLRETLQKNSALVQSEKSKEKDLRRLQKENNTKKYSDEESSSSERDALDPRRQQDPVTDDYKTFIKALPDCPMNRGFHLFVASVDAERCCFCPCGLKMKRWREQFNIEKGHTCETEQRDTPSKFTPNAIVDHLKQLGLPQSGILRPCIYHFCVLKYVEALYENYWGPSQGHKALYKQLSDGYKRAEAAENNEQLKMMKKVQDQLDAANKRSEELEENEKRFEEAMKISPFFIKDLKAKYDKQNEVLEKLGLAGQQREAAELTSTSKKRYDNLHACLCVWGASQFSRLVPNPEENIRIFVDNKFKLSEVFEEWHNNWRSKNPDPTFLFCDINEDNVARFLVPMKVAFRRAKNKKPKGLDKGGLTREFLTDVWKQLDQLDIFVITGDSLVPEGDELLKGKDSEMTLLPKNDESMTDKDSGTTRAYCIAVGRILLYCLVQKIPIAAHVLPDIYKYYLLRDISPRDLEYPLEDLVIHAIDLLPSVKNIFNADSTEHRSIESVIDKVLEYCDDDATTDTQTRFREYIYNQFIADRSIFLESFKEGFTLNGLLQPSECFGAMPLEALNYLLFCNHIIKPGDLIRALVPDYNMPEGDPHFTGNECQHSVLSVKGDGTKEGILVDLLMDSDEEFLRDFLSYATGYQYMPSSDSFCITVEFNYKEMTFESLPVAHTCDFVLKLPGQGYDGNLEVLKQKLDLSFDLVKAYRYDMK